MSRCWAAAIFGGECGGHIDRAHVGLRKQTLKRQGLSSEEVWDPRVWRYCCRVHHDRLDSPWFHLWKHQLPQTVLVFAREKGLEHLIDQADERRRETDGTEDRRAA